MGSSHGFMVKEFHLWNIWKEASVLPALFLHSPLKDWEKDLNTYSCLSLLNVRPACLWWACIFPAVLLCTRHKWTCPSQQRASPTLSVPASRPSGCWEVTHDVKFIYINYLSQTKGQSLHRGCTEESNCRRPQT